MSKQIKTYRTIRLQGMAEIMISAVETKEDCSVHPHVIVGKYPQNFS